MEDPIQQRNLLKTLLREELKDLKERMERIEKILDKLTSKGKQ